MRRHELTDEEWAIIQPLLPNKSRGVPRVDDRRVINGILWRFRTGAPWRDLPRHYGRVGTVSSRFYRWRRSDVWQRVLEALQALADAEERVGWDLHFLDRTVVRAHQHAAGARKAGREPGAEDEALGRSRGGFTTCVQPTPRWEITSGTATLTLDAPSDALGKVRDLFVAAPEGWAFGKPAISIASDRARAKLPVLSRPSGAAMLRRVNLVLTDGEKGELIRAVPVNPG